MQSQQRLCSPYCYQNQIDLVIRIDQVPNDIRQNAPMVKICQFNLQQTNTYFYQGIALECTQEGWTMLMVVFFPYLSVKAGRTRKWLATVSHDSDILARFYLTHIAWEINAVTLMTSQAKSLCIFPRLKAERNYSHAHQIAAMNPLKALGNHCFHTLSSMIA